MESSFTSEALLCPFSSLGDRSVLAVDFVSGCYAAIRPLRPPHQLGQLESLSRPAKKGDCSGQPSAPRDTLPL